jgi:hypothetical protein
VKFGDSPTIVQKSKNKNIVQIQPLKQKGNKMTKLQHIQSQNVSANFLVTNGMRGGFKKT